MDTPALPIPKDSREKEIFERLTALRDQLLLLKQDRANYVRSQDVVLLYDQVIEQVRLLNDIRQGEDKAETQLDKVLESCLQLISLFYMTVGKTADAPAAYSLTSTIKRLLDHLSESKLFAAKDLESMSGTLRQLSAIVKNSESHHSPYMIELLSNRVALCQTTLDGLRKQLSRLGGTLPAIHEKLISVLRSMSLANTRSKFSVSEVQRLQAELKEIQAKQVDGQFVSEDGKVMQGSPEISELLRRCLLWSEIVLDRKGVIPDGFRNVYDVLVSIRNKLDSLSLTQAWSLRETDLYDYQRTLDKIDEQRKDGNFVDDEGNPADLYVQRTLLYLIRRSYGFIYTLMTLSEPVSEALMPIFNQLQTLKNILVNVKNSGGVNSVRELYPYSMKLNNIDNLRVDGKFMHGDDIPEGQGAINELLAECFELAYELRVDAEAKADDDVDSSAPSPAVGTSTPADASETADSGPGVEQLGPALESKLKV